MYCAPLRNVLRPSLEQINLGTPPASKEFRVSRKNSGAGYTREKAPWPRVTNAPAPEACLRLLHQTIDKVTRDIESLNFNTCVSQFMICVNEFASAKALNRDLREVPRRACALCSASRGRVLGKIGTKGFHH